MKSINKWALLALVSSTLAACASSEAPATKSPSAANNSNTPVATAQNTQLDSKVEVAYLCEFNNSNTKRGEKIAMTVLYGVQKNEVVVAQSKVNGTISPGMWRVADNLLNRFVSQDPSQRTTMWTTLPAQANNIAKVDGGKLSVADGDNAQAVVLDNCKLDKAATAKLNK